MITHDEIQTLTDDIVRHFRPEKVVLFGSFASGTPTLGSDADLLVIMDFEGNALDKMAEIIYTVHPKIPVDLVVRTRRMIEYRISIGDPFIKEIHETGRVMYERHNA